MRSTSAADLLGVEVVDGDRDALAAGRGDELGGLLDRLRAVDLGAPLARAAAGAVDGRAGLAERDGDAAARAAGGAGDERDHAATPRASPRASCERGGHDGGEHERAARAAGACRAARRRRGTRACTVTSGSTVERIAALVGPTRSSPAKKRVIAATVETTARHASQRPARAGQLAEAQLAEQRGADDQRGRGAGADERGEHTRAHAPGDAVADEDVGAVDDRHVVTGIVPARLAEEHQDDLAGHVVGGEQGGDQADDPQDGLLSQA